MSDVLELVRQGMKRKLPPEVYGQVEFELSRMNLEHEELLGKVHACQDCHLHATCGVKVPGAGPVPSDIMFCGESPGAVEDQCGIPFSGPAGQLLNSIVKKLGWDRNQIYITNVLKCRTDETNRNPTKAEAAACFQHLKKEIELVKPKVLVCWGSVAASTLIHPDFKITQENGHWFDVHGVRAIAAYHPAYVLRLGDKTPAQKKAKWEVWEAMQKVQKFIDSGFKDDLG